MDTLPQLILASQSLRRRQLLSSMGLSFHGVEPKTLETTPDIQNIDLTIQENAYKKASSVNAQHPTDVVVAADTLVVVGGKVIGKPASTDEARTFLKFFSGKKQTVVTGLALFSHSFGIRRSLEKTEIYFHELAQQQIEDYLLTKEPYDKAGGYAVQGLGSLFIRRMEGSYSNAMGFPVELFLRELNALTKIPLYRWFQ